MRRLAVVTALAVALAGCGGEKGDEQAAPTPQTTTTAAAETCRSVPQPKPRPDGTRKAPARPLAPGKTYLLRFETNCGDFTVRLDQRASPNAAASLAALADAGFFDRTSFHRIVPDFVIQGGDPTASGTGGPGYSTADPPAPNTIYTKGAVAMAKTASEPPGTAGSQFFVVTAGDAGLPPEYALVGRVVEGIAVVERIGRLGDAATELPTAPVVIEKVSLVELS
jgi:cyclophilin family peptidyl-prolyl cis-trans isomerase